MENEIKEVLVEEENVLSNEVNRKSSKTAIIGIAVVAAAALLLKFRKKIGTKIENAMVNQLDKKGYAVLTPDDIAKANEGQMFEVE